MTTINYDTLAIDVCNAMRLGRKKNPGIEIARKEFGAGLIDMILKKDEFKIDEFLPRQQGIIRKLMDTKYGPLVYPSPSGKIKVKKEIGEVLSMAYVSTDERTKKLAMAIRDECWRRGVHALVKSGNDADAKKYYELVPEDTLTELPKIALARVNNFDATLSIGDTQDRTWSKGLEKKLLLGAPSGQKLFSIMDKRKTRWCLLGFPVKMKSKKDYLVPEKEYEKVYIDSIKETYAKETKKISDYYAKSLKGKDKIHITANDGTNLKFSIKGRPILSSDGIIDENDIRQGDVGLNIPDGEAFCAPLEHTANGRIFFDYVNISGIGFIKGGLWITFKDGKVMRYEAKNKEGNEIFKTFLASNTGEKDRIAELGIGTNKGSKFIGTIIVDEKIYGTIHIAIGSNKGAYHGKNEASSHLDMIKVMKGKEGNLEADGKFVMKNGEPVGRV